MAGDDQTRVDTFADATDDHQWIHTDAERAASGPFGGTIAHGYLTLSLVPSLLKQLMTITDHGRGTNYGLEKVRFTSVVPVGRGGPPRRHHHRGHPARRRRRAVPRGAADRDPRPGAPRDGGGVDLPDLLGRLSGDA